MFVLNSGCNDRYHKRGIVVPLFATCLIFAATNLAAQEHGQHGEGAAHHRVFDDPAEYTKTWDDPARDTWQRPAELVAALGMLAGMAVADIGTGTGYLLPHLSRAAGAAGQVYAVDISPEMLTWVGERAKREGLANISTVKATGDSTRLETASIDRAIMINVWHHVENPDAYAKDLNRSLRPGGVVFIVEAHPDAEQENGPPRHFRLQPEAVMAQFERAGFSVSLEPLTLDRQYVIRASLQQK
jgi:SAM-dependent methyltransferase